MIKPINKNINMSDKRISDTILKQLNLLIETELLASQVYQAMSEWCQYNGYTGSSNWFKEHLKEEQGHMQKVYEYIQDRDEMPTVPTVPQPNKLIFTNLMDVFIEAYKHEKLVTGRYNELSKMCISEGEFMTLDFALSFLREQKEEEAKIKTYIDELSVVGDDKAGIFAFDKYIND